MTWVRIDENMVDHPKIAGLSDRAFRLWITALAYANRFETDGKVDAKMAQRLVEGAAKATVRELVSAGLWHENGTGYLIHDYLDYQPSRAENGDLRAKRAAAGRLGGLSKRASKPEASASSLLQAKSKPVPSHQDRSLNQEDSTEDEGTPKHILSLLHAMGETEHSSCHAELLSWKARGASERDFREATRALSQRRPRNPRAYATRILENAITERAR